ncbi:MAG: hypothetical protein JST30_00395 [Armatimonadetes bacterium]|nr:hypothetical protein [Armatimonadota bacterium]
MAQWAEFRNGARAIAFLSWRQTVNKNLRKWRTQRAVSGITLLLQAAMVIGFIYLLSVRPYDPTPVVFDPGRIEGLQRGGFIVGLFVAGCFFVTCLLRGTSFTREDADVLFPTPVPNAVLIAWKMTWVWSVFVVVFLCALPTWHGRPVWFMGGLIDASLVALVRDSVLSLLFFASVAASWSWGIGLALLSDEDRFSGLRKLTGTLGFGFMALAGGALVGSVAEGPWRWAAEFMDRPWIHALFWPIDLFLRLATHEAMGYGRYALADLAAVLVLQFGGLWMAYAMRGHVCHVSSRNLHGVPLGHSHVEETTGKPDKQGWIWRRRQVAAKKTVRGLDAVWWRAQVQAYGLTPWWWGALLVVLVLAPIGLTASMGHRFGGLMAALVVPAVMLTREQSLAQTAQLAKSLPFELRSLLAMDLKITTLPMIAIMEAANLVHVLLGTYPPFAALAVAVMVPPALILHNTVGLYVQFSDVKPQHVSGSLMYVRILAHAVWAFVIAFTAWTWNWPALFSVPIAVVYCLVVSTLAWRSAVRLFEAYCPVEYSMD